MICCEFAVHLWMRLAEVEGCISSVIGRKFLFDDVGLYCYSKMIGLCGEICRRMIIRAIFFETAVAEVTPQHCCHSKFMCLLKCHCDLSNLACRFWRTKINCCAHCSRTHVVCTF